MSHGRGNNTQEGNDFIGASSHSSSSSCHFSGSQANNALEETTTSVRPIFTSTAEEDEVTFFHDFISGGIAGSASIVVGHPFDTIKVRLQTSSAASGSLRSMASSFGGFSSLFRGLAAPLSTAAIVNATIFSGYGAGSRIYDSYYGHQPSELRHDPWQKAFLCGSFAGGVQCIVICPMEHLKCRLQIQHGKGAADCIYKGPVQAAEQIVMKHGIFNGLFRGWNATCFREVPSFGVYFSTYDYIKDRIQDFLLEQQRSRILHRIHATMHNNNNNQQQGGGSVSTSITYKKQIEEQCQYEEDEYAHARLLLSSSVAGGIAGCLTWLCVYPIDVVKTRIQTNPLGSNMPHHRRFIPVARSIIAKQGWRVLFRGMGITLLRAFPVNGTIFPVYEYTMMHVTNLRYDHNHDFHHHF